MNIDPNFPLAKTPEVKNITVNGRYLIHEKIGEGGMGVVYRATDRLSEHILAFKQVIVPTWEFAVDGNDMAGGLEENLRLALAHEFETLASLRHPNIISVLDYGFDEERRPYFTMDYLMGAKTILDAGQGLDEMGKVHLIQQMLQALAYLHRRGILHRDLKPANVLVTYRTVRILDFGLATTQKSTMQAAGSIPYIAPEVWEDQPHTEAADLYAVGIIAFELFAGRHPFDINSPQFLSQVLDNAPDLSLLNTSPEITAVISKLINKNHQERYSSAEACIAAFSQAMGLPIPAESIAIRESYLQSALFVGRTEETGLLLEALDEAKQGYGSSWLVSGESGVGKSRLLDEIGTQALVQGALVLRGQTIEDVAGSPLQLWREALRRLVLAMPLDDLSVGVLQALIPDIGRLLQREVYPAPELNAPAARQRLISTITNLFNNKNQWVLLILEDLHWADAGLEILRQLSRLAPRLPLLIIGSYRTDERASMADDLPLMEELPLNRLSSDEITALSTSMLGKAGENPEVLALLQRETEGNAFFLVEVVRALAEEAGRLSAIGRSSLPQQLFPQGIQTIVQRRLARVPDAAVPLLVGTAVAGRQVDLNLLPMLAESTKTIMPTETWLATCAEAAVLELFNENWRFAHDKLRSGILETINPERQKGWHQTIAQHMEQIYPDQVEQAATLTHHWKQAGNQIKERHYARLAGEYAQQQFLNQTALDYYQQALNLTPDDDLLGQFDLHLAREQIFHMLGQRDEQKEVLATLGSLADQLAQNQGEDKRAAVALRLANYADATGDYSSAIAAAEQSRQVALENNDTYYEAASYLAIGRALLRQGKYDETKSSYETCLQAAQTHHFTKLEADTRRALGVLAYDTGQLEKALSLYDQCLPLYESLKNKQGESTVYNNISVVAFSKGNIEQSLVSLEKAQKIDGEIGDREGLARILTNLSSLYLDLGSFELAQTYATEGLTLCREIDVPFGEVLNLVNLSLAAHFLEDDTQAEAFSQEAMALAEKIGSPFLAGLVLKDRGFLLLSQENYSDAIGAYRAALDALAQTDQVLEAHAGLAWLALSRKDETAVSTHITPIIEHLKGGQSLDGTSRPFYILLLTYKVLATRDDPYADEVLEMAYGRLVHWANQITDDDRRDSFLERVPANLEISILFEAKF